MPSNVIETPEDEKKWEKAEALAATQGNAKNYAYIMGIYKRMKPDHNFKSAASPPPPGSMFTAFSHYTDIAGMGQFSSTFNLPFMVNEDGSASLMERGKPSTARENMLSRKEVAELFRRGRGRGLNVNTYLSDPEMGTKHRVHNRHAFNKYNAPELVSQLMAVLKKAGLDDAVNQLKMKKVPQIIDKAWRDRVGRAASTDPLAMGFGDLIPQPEAMAQPLMLQPDYGSEEEHPCQHGGECQCAGACQGRVAARAMGARGGFLPQSKKVEAFRDLGWALAGRPDVAQKIERVLVQHRLGDMAKVMWKAFSDLQADLDFMYMD